MEFGSEIKSLRLAAGLTQAQLAGLAGKHLRTIERWESVKNDNWGTLIYIQAVLELQRRIKEHRTC